MEKYTKEDVQKVFKSLRDKDKVEEIKQMFYVDSIKGACFKACQLYGFDKGYDMTLELIAFLLHNNMIEPAEFLNIACEVVMDFNEKEGEDHGKD